MIETKINIRYKRKNKYINKTAITDIYTLSLHDALPISIKKPPRFGGMKTYNWEGVNPDGYFLDKLEPIPSGLTPSQLYVFIDRKSGSAGMPRPNSYAVLCLKKKGDAQLMDHTDT